MKIKPANQKYKVAFNKLQEMLITVVGVVLSIWLLAGLFGFWALLPQNTPWLIIKIVSVALLVFVLIIHSEGAEDKTFREQLFIIGKLVLGFTLVIAIGILIILMIRGSGSAECNYPWSSGCP